MTGIESVYCCLGGGATDKWYRVYGMCDVICDPNNSFLCGTCPKYRRMFRSYNIAQRILKQTPKCPPSNLRNRKLAPEPPLPLPLPLHGTPSPAPGTTTTLPSVAHFLFFFMPTCTWVSLNNMLLSKQSSSKCKPCCVRKGKLWLLLEEGAKRR